MARALAALPPGVEIPVERRLGRVESRFLDTGVAVTVERETTLVHMAMRAPLDLALAEAARAAGATLAARRAVERIGLAADHVETRYDQRAPSRSFPHRGRQGHRDGGARRPAGPSRWPRCPRWRPRWKCRRGCWPGSPTAPASISASRSAATAGSFPRPIISRSAWACSPAAGRGGGSATSSPDTFTCGRSRGCEHAARPRGSHPGPAPRRRRRGAECCSPAMPPASRTRSRARDLARDPDRSPGGGIAAGGSARPRRRGRRVSGVAAPTRSRRASHRAGPGVGALPPAGSRAPPLCRASASSPARR